MLIIDKDGIVQSPRVRLTHTLFKGGTAKSSISPYIERDAMPVVRGIIVHQTATETARQPLNSYGNNKKKLPDETTVTFKPDGAHFLIDKDGTIYQTASLNKTTAHVGPLRGRCLLDMSCATPVELANLKKWNGNPGPTTKMHSHHNELLKTVPKRFPENSDSIGIECVGETYTGLNPEKPEYPRRKPPLGSTQVFVSLTNEQKQSLRWLISALSQTLKVPMTEVFRHPVVSFKNETEAESAQATIDDLQKEEREAKRAASQ